MFTFPFIFTPLFAGIGNLMQTVFGGDYPKDELELHQIVARAIVVYLVGVLIVRLGKSRTLARTTTLDVILAFILGSLLSRGITGHASLSGTSVACAALVACHWALTAAACRSHILGDILKGHSRQVVKDGQMLLDAMYRSNISYHDLYEQMRLAGIGELSEVAQAYKERNGEISFIKRKPSA